MDNVKKGIASRILGRNGGSIRNKMSPRLRRQNRIAWFVIGPMLAYFLIFSIIPLVMGIFLSFTEYNGFDAPKLIGFDHYIDIFADAEFWQILWRTFFMSGMIFIISNVLSFFLGLLLTVNIRGKTSYRVIWYIPSVVSLAAISFIFGLFLKPTSTGLFNMLLAQFGVEPVLWSRSAFWMNFWIIFMCVWKGLGGSMIFYLAAFNSVNPELFEAAMVDGANRWQKLIHIMIPSVKPMLVFILITNTISIFGIFEPVQIISDGGPDGQTRVLMYEIYDAAYRNFNLGYSSAISTIVFIIVMAVTALEMKLTKFNFAA